MEWPWVIRVLGRELPGYDYGAINVGFEVEGVYEINVPLWYVGRLRSCNAQKEEHKNADWL